jgi:hypothetical protein
MARKRYRKPGDLTQLRAVLWRTILEVEDLLDVPQRPPDLVLKSAHALAQLAGAYRAVLETVDIDARLTALEHRLSRTEVVHNGHIPP